MALTPAKSSADPRSPPRKKFVLKRPAWMREEDEKRARESAARAKAEAEDQKGRETGKDVGKGKAKRDVNRPVNGEGEYTTGGAVDMFSRAGDCLPGILLEQEEKRKRREERKKAKLEKEKDALRRKSANGDIKDENTGRRDKKRLKPDPDDDDLPTHASPPVPRSNHLSQSPVTKYFHPTPATSAPSAPSEKSRGKAICVDLVSDSEDELHRPAQPLNTTTPPSPTTTAPAAQNRHTPQRPRSLSPDLVASDDENPELAAAARRARKQRTQQEAQQRQKAQSTRPNGLGDEYNRTRTTHTVHSPGHPSPGSRITPPLPTPPTDTLGPVLSFLIDNSTIPDTVPLVIKRRYLQSLGDVTRAWCERNGLDARDHVFSWRGKKVWPSTTPRGLGVQLADAGSGELLVTRGHDDGFDLVGEKVVIRAWTRDAWEESEREGRRRRGMPRGGAGAAGGGGAGGHGHGPGLAEGPAADEDLHEPLPPPEKMYKVLLKCPKRQDVRLRVRESSEIARVVGAWRSQAGQDLPPDAKIAIRFDGEELHPSVQVGKTEIAEGEEGEVTMLEVHLK